MTFHSINFAIETKPKIKEAINLFHIMIIQNTSEITVKFKIAKYVKSINQHFQNKKQIKLI